MFYVGQELWLKPIEEQVGWQHKKGEFLKYYNGEPFIVTSCSEECTKASHSLAHNERVSWYNHRFTTEPPNDLSTAKEL